MLMKDNPRAYFQAQLDADRAAGRPLLAIREACCGDCAVADGFYREYS